MNLKLFQKLIIIVCFGVTLTSYSLGIVDDVLSGAANITQDAIDTTGNVVEDVVAPGERVIVTPNGRVVERDIVVGPQDDYYQDDYYQDEYVGEPIVDVGVGDFGVGLAY